MITAHFFPYIIIIFAIWLSLDHALLFSCSHYYLHYGEGVEKSESKRKKNFFLKGNSHVYKERSRPLKKKSPGIIFNVNLFYDKII